MCSNEPMKPFVKREVAEVDDDVVEILPRRAVAPNGKGFSVKIRDTSDLSMADVQHVKPFLRRPISEPTKAATFTLKEVARTGGWEINIEDTSALSSTHMRSIIDIIASRERDLQGRLPHQHVPPQQRSPVPPQQQSPVGTRVLPRRQRASRPPKNPNAPKRPLNPFFLWLAENRYRFNRPGMPVTEVTAAAGIAWKALSNEEQERWNALAAEEKQRYQREMVEYQKDKRNP